MSPIANDKINGQHRQICENTIKNVLNNLRCCSNEIPIPVSCKEKSKVKLPTKSPSAPMTANNLFVYLQISLDNSYLFIYLLQTVNFEFI